MKKYIDADAATAELCRKWRGDEAAKQLAVDVVGHIPEADVRENARGRWVECIVEDANPLFRRRFYCSVCGDWQTYGITNFCPDCGAEMK